MLFQDFRRFLGLSRGFPSRNFGVLQDFPHFSQDFLPMFGGLKLDFQGFMKLRPKKSESQDSNLTKNSILESVRFQNRKFSTLKKNHFFAILTEFFSIEMLVSLL